MLMDRVARIDRRSRWHELSVVLMDDAGIASLNQRYLGSRAATDVLSFRYAIPCEDGPRASGEVAVNVDCALREGPRRGGASRELALYIAHGCNHLAGRTDRTREQQKRMRATERRWLREIGGCVDLARILKTGP